MPFIGNQPALSYTSFAKQDFTTSATTSYTLDHPVTNENEIALFINFVRQEPTTAYTASGTSLTLTSATSASDDMYCVFLGKAVQTVNPPVGSVGASQISDGSIALGKLSATGTKDATTFLRGDNTFASAGGDNTPAFRATMSANQTGLSSEANTKVSFNTETYDIGSCYDHSSNFRFTVPSGEDGKYLITAHIHTRANGAHSGKTCRLYKNGSFLTESQTATAGDNLHATRTNNSSVTTIENLSATDYIEVYAKVFGSTWSLQNEGAYFSAFKIIE